MVSDAQKRAKIKYDMKTCQYAFRFRLGADADIINRLNDVPNRTDYIRKLIRRDIRGE